MTTPTYLQKRALLTAVATKNRAEIHRVLVTRRRYLAHVLNDARTRALFTRWRQDSRLDLVITAWSGQLNVATAQLGLPDRQTLLRDVDANFARLPIVAVQFFNDCERLFEIRYEGTSDARAAEAVRFIDAVLFARPPRMRVWLELALLDAFWTEAISEIRGESMPVTLVAGSLIDLPEKDGYTPDDEKLERGADWYYRAENASPKATHGELTREYIAARKREGVIIEPDTGLIPNRIKEADRLLNRLVIPPVEAWRFLTTTQKSS